MIANTVLSALAWATLFERSTGRAVVRGYFFSLLGKYVPGAIWQALGQVSSARRSGVTLAAASVAFPLQALGQVAAAGTLALIFAIGADHAASWFRICCGLGVLSVAPLVSLSWLPPTLGFFSRLTRRKIEVDVIPAPRRILASYGLSLVGLSVAAVAFAMVLRALGSTAPSFVVAASAFAVAWGIGLLAIPVPAGLGIREGVLVLAFAGTVGSVPIIAASAIVRLITVAAEIVVLGAATVTFHVPKDVPS